MTQRTELVISLKDLITQRLTKVQAGFKALGDRIDRVTVASRKAGAAWDQIGGSFDKVAGTAGKGLVALTGAGYAFKRGFVDTAAQFERFRLQLEALEGSSSAADSAMAWISDFATRTPLELEGVVSAYARLRAFGLDPTNGSLQSITDQVAKLGGGQAELEGIVMALGQAWTKEKLQGEEALQLIERGVPVWELLAEATGKSTAELVELSSAGKLGRREIALLLEVMGKKSAGASARFARSWDGMVSNLGDQWTRFSLMVMDGGVFAWLQTRLSNFLALVDGMAASGELKALAERVSGGMIRTLDTLERFGRGLMVVFRAVGRAASWAAERVGGWENLGKIIAGLTLAAPFLQLATAVVGAVSAVRTLMLLLPGLAAALGPISALLAVGAALPVLLPKAAKWIGGDAAASMARRNGQAPSPAPTASFRRISTAPARATVPTAAQAQAAARAAARTELNGTLRIQVDGPARVVSAKTSQPGVDLDVHSGLSGAPS